LKVKQKIFKFKKKEVRREILVLIDLFKAEKIINEHGVEGVGACFILLGNGKTSFSPD
jgi:hypothetical protein